MNLSPCSWNHNPSKLKDSSPIWLPMSLLPLLLQNFMGPGAGENGGGANRKQEILFLHLYSLIHRNPLSWGFSSTFFCLHPVPSSRFCATFESSLEGILWKQKIKTVSFPNPSAIIYLSGYSADPRVYPGILVGFSQRERIKCAYYILTRIRTLSFLNVNIFINSWILCH